VLWTIWATGRNFRCSFPPPHSWLRQARSRGRVALFFGSFLCQFPWADLLFLGTGLGGGQRGSLGRAATVRTADRQTGQNVRRHDLDKSNVSMNKPKKKALHSMYVRQATCSD